MKTTITTMKISALKPAPYNPRKISTEALQGLTESVKRFGLVQPIVFNKRSGYVVGGHQRIQALLAAGEEEAAVVVVDLSPAEEKTLNVALNNPHIGGKFTDELQAILEEIKKHDMPAIASLNLDTLGVDVFGHGTKDGNTDPDFIPEAPLKAKTKRGDIYVLGNHRLMCGDSSSADDLKRLLAGARIHLINTDPPYNVKAEPRSNNAMAAGNSSFQNKNQRATHKNIRAKDRPIMNDSMKPEEFDRMLRGWFKNMSAALIPGRAFYIWGGYANCANYPPALKECEMYFSQTIIWVKGHPVMGRKDYMGNHEWCFHGWREDPDNVVLAPGGFSKDHRYAFYGWKEGAAHYFDPVTFNATDVWMVKKVNPQSMVHLTEKPVELAVKAMQYSSRPGENVLDLFGGSGSTMIAAQQTDRKAFLMEMDPLYCDIIVERWEKFTGKKSSLQPRK